MGLAGGADRRKAEPKVALSEYSETWIAERRNSKRELLRALTR